MSTIQLLDEIQWTYDSNPRVIAGKGFGSTVEVDPFPGYTHDKLSVRQTLDKVQSYFPDIDVKVYICKYEPVSRVLGFAQQNIYWDKDDQQARDNVIFLSGKRTPIHPALTRYIVAHEFGHQVEYRVEEQLGIEREELMEWYGKKRGIEPIEYYGGPTWEHDPAEVFANDFRVYVAKVELEFWPHICDMWPPKQVRKWWQEALKGNYDISKDTINV